ncbi:hypothetical protein B7494_g6809 [Chlorociboria aeruginascens]|nr:hypothetical protein B7494_g6809 [Chlorociboria aeruginascens]
METIEQAKLDSRDMETIEQAKLDSRDMKTIEQANADSQDMEIIEQAKAGSRVRDASMPIIVSINNIGRPRGISQVHLLPSDWQICYLGDILDLDIELKLKLAATNWWWESSTDEFVTEIFKAVVRRHSRAANAGSAHRLAVIKCGATMFEAVALAMIMVKDKHQDFTVAKATFDTIISKAGLTIPQEHYTILVKHYSDFSGLDGVLEPTPQHGQSSSTDADHDYYRIVLNQVVSMHEEMGEYDLVCDEPDWDSQRQTQDDIREYLSSANILPNLLRPTFEGIKTIYAIAGLSESGKTTVADMIQRAYGTDGARLKKSYLLREVSNRLGCNIDSLSGARQASALLQGLDDFSRYHRFISTLTIESVHRHDSISFLKSYLGSLLHIIYVDTRAEVRWMRTARSQRRMEQKDAVKKERGTECIKEIANTVLDNNGSEEMLYAALMKALTGRELNLDFA